MDAYVEYSGYVLDLQIQPNKYLEKWGNLIQGIDSKGLRNNSISKIIDQLINHAQSVPPIFFDIYGELINKPELLLENIDIVRKLFAVLIEKKNTRGIKWLGDLLKQYPNLLKKYDSSDDVISFKQRIFDSLDHNSIDDNQELLKDIASRLDIMIPDEKILEQ
jgi:hypothetical protein